MDVYETITKLTAEELALLIKLQPLLEEAKQAADMIRKVYVFHIGEEKIEVWKDSNNHEYLTNKGIWQARYMRQRYYEVDCTEAGIFDLLRAEFLIKEGYEARDNKGILTKDGEKSIVLGYFQRFLEETKEKWRTAITE